MVICSIKYIVASIYEWQNSSSTDYVIIEMSSMFVDDDVSAIEKPIDFNISKEGVACNK